MLQRRTIGRASLFPDNPPSDRQTVRVEKGDAQIAPVDREARVEEHGQHTRAEILITGTDDSIRGSKGDGPGGRSDFCASRVERDPVIAWLKNQLQSAVGQRSSRDLRQLCKLRDGKECLVSSAVCRHRARDVASHGKLYQSRIGCTCCRARIRFGLSRQATRGNKDGEDQCRCSSTEAHGRRTSRESRAGGVANTSSGGKSSRCAATSTRSR